jgi:monovalent cation/hydrogen antiporter
MHEFELVLALLVPVAALVALARRIQIPYPILLVVGGLVLGFIPGLPRVELAPEIVFLVFLPPILYAAAWLTSWRDFRANLRPITLLAFGLVLATTGIVAVVAHALIPGLGWPAAFVLGAIVSPPDAVAATAIAQRLGVPRRIVTVLEGESLVNDATALVAYRASVVAVTTGAFSLGAESLRFVYVAAGGVAVGLLVGVAVQRVWRRIEDPSLSVTVSLLVPFASYLAAENLGASGVLAVVASGLCLGRRSATILTPEERVRVNAVWGMVIFLVNGLVFILIGLQLPAIMERLSDRSLGGLVGLGIVLSVTVILVRMVWVFPGTYLPRLVSRRLRERDPSPPWQWVVVLGWAGLRGVVSLAAALALPLTDAGGAPFPERDLIVFLTFCVILATLVGQGLSLPWLIRRLGLGDDGAAEHEEAHARVAATEAALTRLADLQDEWPTHRELVDQLRARYEHASQHVDPHRESTDAAEQELLEHRQIYHEVIAAQRNAVIGMRDRGAIGDEVLRRIERDLDLEELRMEA